MSASPVRLYCSRCGDNVILPFTDETETRVDITPAEAWEVEGTVTKCPCCAIGKHPYLAATNARLEATERVVKAAKAIFNPARGDASWLHDAEFTDLAAAIAQYEGTE